MRTIVTLQDNWDEPNPPHCNTLQHTATHCNTLQHTATLCNTLQHLHHSGGCLLRVTRFYTHRMDSILIEWILYSCRAPLFQSGAGVLYTCTTPCDRLCIESSYPYQSSTRVVQVFYEDEITIAMLRMQGAGWCRVMSFSAKEPYN